MVTALLEQKDTEQNQGKGRDTRAKSRRGRDVRLPGLFPPMEPSTVLGPSSYGVGTDNTIAN